MDQAGKQSPKKSMMNTSLTPRGAWKETRMPAVSEPELQTLEEQRAVSFLGFGCLEKRRGWFLAVPCHPTAGGMDGQVPLELTAAGTGVDRFLTSSPGFGLMLSSFSRV